jgi:hypothetical protein
MIKVREGSRPARPSREECMGPYLGDALWKVVEMCWKQEPRERPSMNEVLRHFALMAGVSKKSGTSPTVNLAPTPDRSHDKRKELKSSNLRSVHINRILNAPSLLPRKHTDRHNAPPTKQTRADKSRAAYERRLHQGGTLRHSKLVCG